MKRVVVAGTAVLALAAALLTAPSSGAHSASRAVVASYVYSGTERIYAHYDPTRKNAPWVLEVHGGYWESGTGSSSGIAAWAEHERARGFQAFAIDYRLSSQAPWPAQLEDAEAAVDWVQAHARTFGLAANRGVLSGGSAGGLLSSIAAMRGGVVGAIDKAGVVDPQAALTAPNPHLAASALELLGCDYASCPDTWRAARAQTYIGPRTPQFLIIHSVDDQTVPAAMSRAFYGQLRAAGRTATLSVIPGSTHSMGLKPSVLAMTDAFMDKVVAKPASWPVLGPAAQDRLMKVQLGAVVQGDVVHYNWRLDGHYIRAATRSTYRVPRSALHHKLAVTIRVLHGSTVEWSGTSQAKTVWYAPK